MSGALLFGMLWSLVLLGVYLALPRWLPSVPKISTRSAWILIIGCALIARLVPNIVLPMGAGSDIGVFHFVGNLFLQGEDIYTSTEFNYPYPYLPLHLYWSAISAQAAAWLNISFLKIIRLLPIAADLAIALVLYASLRTIDRPEGALYAALAYALNPIPVYVSAYHGQFDALAALFALLALAWIAKSPLISGGWLGLGILSKSWPVLALPSLFVSLRDRRKRFLFLTASVLVPGLAILLYQSLIQTDPLEIIFGAVDYNWGMGVWGYTYFLALLSSLKPDLNVIFIWVIKYARYATLFGLGLVWWIKARKQTPQNGFLTILVAFFAITHAFGIQYLVWLVPFALLCQEDLWLRRYTLAVFAYMFLVYNTLILEMHIDNLIPWPQADRWLIIPASLPIWLVCIWWTWQRIRD